MAALSSDLSSDSSGTDSSNENPDDEVVLRRSKRRVAQGLVQEEPVIQQQLASLEPCTPKRRTNFTEKDKVASKVASKKGKQENASSRKRSRADLQGENKPDDKKKKPSNRKMLKKVERDEIVKAIKGLSQDDIAQKVALQLRESNHTLKIIDDLVGDAVLFRSIIDCHTTTFVQLYEENSMGKEKYLKFQIEWHNRCSVFLLPEGSSLDSVIKNTCFITSIRSIHSSWLSFCKMYPDTEFQVCCNIMINLSSCVYSMLLDIVHSRTKTNTIQVHKQGSDKDDVYYRFGGSVLSNMHHSRYKAIRTCVPQKRDEISLEIDVLHALNSKEKSSLPSYLRYRDRGFMYSPHPDVIPFIRDVDSCIKEIVNDKELIQTGDKIVKVHNYIHVCALLTYFMYIVGGPFSSAGKKSAKRTIHFHFEEANDWTRR